MTYIPTVTINPSQMTFDAGGRARVSQITTLGDYRQIDYIRHYQYSFATNTSYVPVMTGTDINKFHMHVDAGQFWYVQTRQHHVYFSGKAQTIEFTCDNFAPQTNVTKRYGYFGGDMTYPFGNLDGIWVESSNGTVTFNIANAGTTIYSKPWTQWAGYSYIQNYNWNNFTVFLIDFLWLGGAIARLFMMTPSGFIMVDSYSFAGVASGTFIQSPHQPLRADLISSGGVGDFRIICATVGTEGSPQTITGYTRAINSLPTGHTFSGIGTKTVVLAAKRNVLYNDAGLLLDGLFLSTQTLGDSLFWTLEVNPTINGDPLVWNSLSDSAIQYAYGNDTNIVPASGASIYNVIVASGVLNYGQVIPADVVKQSFVSWFGQDILGNQDVYAITVTPLVGSSTVVAGMSIKEF